MIEFVPCITNSIVRKAQNSFCFDIFPLFLLTILFNCWLDFLLQGLFLAFFVVDGVIDFLKIGFVTCVGIMKFRKCQNVNTDVYIQTPISVKLQAWSFQKRSNSYFGTFWEVLGAKIINSVSPLESWWTRIAGIVCMMGLIWFRNSCFSKLTGLVSSLEVLSFLLVLEYSAYNHWFSTV